MNSIKLKAETIYNRVVKNATIIFTDDLETCILKAIEEALEEGQKTTTMNIDAPQIKRENLAMKIMIAKMTQSTKMTHEQILYQCTELIKEYQKESFKEVLKEAFEAGREKINSTEPGYISEKKYPTFEDYLNR
jgi:ribosomal protein S7